MTVFSMTVGYNEADRYLEQMLRHTRHIVDKMFFFDDQSTDDTFEIAQEYADAAVRRLDSEAGFMDDEGLFRQAAWNCFERVLQPQTGDWVFVIDCDQFPVSTCSQSARACLENALCIEGQTNGICLTIPEVFAIDDDGTPLIRTDGLWAHIFAPRIVPYKPGAQFKTGRFGVPGVPSYAQAGPWVSEKNLVVLHYGYARYEDQATKYWRYVNQPGHSQNHIRSIIQPPTLEPWQHQIPEEF